MTWSPSKASDRTSNATWLSRDDYKEQCRSTYITFRLLTRSKAIVVPQEFSPRPFRGPPNDHASAKNENCQRKPCIEVKGHDTRSKHNHRCDHREIVRARVAAVGPSAPP